MRRTVERALLFLALWGVLAALYDERHPPASAGGWAVLVASCGVAALVLLGLAIWLAWLAERLRGRGRR